MSALIVRPAPNTPRVTRGAPIRADDQNSTQAGLAALQALRAAVYQQMPRPWTDTQLYQITQIRGDYLEAQRVYIRGGTTIIGTQTVYVAKPARLRESETSRDGVTYVYTDSQTRTASKAGEDDETQRVTPTYLVGDWIEAATHRGNVGITEVDNQRGSPVDVNVDGRAWAAEPPAS